MVVPVYSGKKLFVVENVQVQPFKSITMLKNIIYFLVVCAITFIWIKTDNLYLSIAIITVGVVVTSYRVFVYFRKNTEN